MLRRFLRKFPASWKSRLRDERDFRRLGRRHPELLWRSSAPCPVALTEGHCARIGERLFLFGGYHSLDHVLSLINVFDLKARKWIEQLPMPPEVPQTHAGVVADEQRYVYFVAGQVGPQCCPAVADCYVYDTETNSWSELPALPLPRYSPAVQLCRGRLHAIGGGGIDRGSTACEHWSIGVANGRATENSWREETPAPRGGPHRASFCFNGSIFLLGGQEGDIQPRARDPAYTCDFDTPLEKLYADSFVLESGGREWKQIAPMPVAQTHSEDHLVVDHYAVVSGGNAGRYQLSDLVQVFDLEANRWRVAGRLPWHMKTSTTYYNGFLYVFAGQRSLSRQDLRPDHVLNSVWRARFDPARDTAADWPKN